MNHDTRSNHEAEKSLLSAIITRASSLYESLQLIPAEAIDEPTHRAVYDAALRLVARRIPVTERTVVDELRRGGADSAAVGLVESLPAYKPTDFASALIDVQDAFVRREATRLAMEMVTDSGDIHMPVEDLLSKAEARLSAISGATAESRPRSFAEVSQTFLATFDERRSKPNAVTGLATGLVDFDRMTGGLQPEDLIILAGRPSMGKSACALTMALGVARTGKRVAFFSLEMRTEDLHLRAASQLSRVTIGAIRSGLVSEGEAQAVHRAMAEASALPLHYDDTAVLTTNQLLGKCFQHRQRHGLDLVIVDYLQMMRGPRDSSARGGNREQEVAAISRSLKGLARSMRVPVLALAQLSRGVESRTDKKPMLSDLRESGQIEQDADVVAFCYRPEYYGKTHDDDLQPVKGKAQLIIAKQRNGSTGEATFRFDGPTAAWQGEFEGSESSPESMRLHDRIETADTEAF